MVSQRGPAIPAGLRRVSLAEPGREQVYFTDGFLGHGTVPDEGHEVAVATSNRGVVGDTEPARPGLHDVDLESVFAAARAHGKAVEINSSPERLDLSETHARRAAELGIPVAISTDTHYLSELDHLELGLAVARRAWLTPAHVLNTRPLADLLAWKSARR